MKRIVICLIFVLLLVGFANAQNAPLTGKVEFHSTGTSDNSEAIVVQVGKKKYIVYLFRQDFPTPKTVGTVNEVGRTVQVFYTKIVKSKGYDGELRATKIVEVKPKK